MVFVRLIESRDFKDLNVIQKLYKDLGYEMSITDINEQLTKIYQHQDYYMLLLIKDEKIIGFSGMCKMMFYEKRGYYMRILAFVVDHNYRQLGYGTYLINKSESLAKSLDCNVIALNSGIKLERNNAYHFYHRNNYIKKSYGYSKTLK
ncbi:GNAT family N-acetyltransferase [Staphylococcus agnetis]|uniref:GNAT family N-acetyltransferase n=1 Tax=Staphylococcus agnetis TaxID=985762 RepID=UPI0004E34CC3|nr:GNAT family N-acetyltransferase [Staphylococcus agnetis]KFE42150.1 hypothetical protein SAGN_04975 [Staphylococcus agnetis]NJH65765.1 GNAT family N-acetyltransferase [Staphylococcus agnetis]NJH96553.1 GNAT family N-acetyltransferase [Staphylococcus agnetis]PTH47624.1 N-acetyltransferase [Staphylococcus agnetis]PTH74471.1 N-acetyltransferase [Staphylococcus agnetis]